MEKTVKPSLYKVNKALARQWHPTKNAPLAPRDVTCGSNKKVWWVCKKGHEWQATIHARTNRGNGCPYCSGRAVDKDNCFRARNPKLAREWHPIRNAPLTPDSVAAGTQKKAWWICAKGHEWEAEVNSRNRGTGCPYCSGNKVSWDNCLQTVNPTLAAQWHPTKNAPLTPKDVTHGSEKKVWWVCKKNHEWQAPISARKKGVGCPYCANKRAYKDNCLQTRNPKLAREWHPTRNAPLTAKDVTYGSEKKAWWTCKKGHEWEYPVFSRNQGVGCPYCANKRVAKDNCLQTVNPKLAREWHPTRNVPLTPKEVVAGTWQKVWWVCGKGHVWKTHVASRNQGSGCPYCAGRRASKENCLQTLNPWIAREWHPTKNRAWTPQDVAPYSRRQMWWKCGNGHEQRERVVDRYKRGGCLVCTLKARAPRLFEATLEVR